MYMEVSKVMTWGYPLFYHPFDVRIYHEINIGHFIALHRLGASVLRRSIKGKDLGGSIRLLLHQGRFFWGSFVQGDDFFFRSENDKLTKAPGKQTNDYGSAIDLNFNIMCY